MTETRPEEAGPERTGPERTRPGGNGPDGSGPGRNGPDRNGPSRNGPSRNGPDGTGPEEAGTSTARRWRSKPWKWLLGAVGATLAGHIATLMLGAWPALDDLRKDVTGQEPLRVVARARSWGGEVNALSRPLTSGPDRFLLLRGMTREQWEDLLRRHRAAQVGRQDLIIVVQGRRNAAVRVLDIRPHVLSAGPVLRGTCIRIPSQGRPRAPVASGPPGTRGITADLDRPRSGGNRPAAFPAESADLAAGDRLTVEMTVLAGKRSYEYELEVTYDYGDGADFRTMYVRRPDGEPFRVTGEAARYGVAYADSGTDFRTYREIGRNRSCRH